MWRSDLLVELLRAGFGLGCEMRELHVCTCMIETLIQGNTVIYSLDTIIQDYPLHSL